MTDRTLKEKAAKLQALTAEIAKLEEQAEKLKADIQSEMERRAVDELKAGSALIRWKEVTSTRFDSKAFQQSHSRLYEQFARKQTTRRFTVMPA